METVMAEVPVEVKKTPPAQTSLPDVWQSFRSEMDRLFDRFGGGFGLSLRRMFDMEPAWRSSFSFSMPSIDMSEDDKTYKISAELRGMDSKNIDVSVTGDMLVLEGEKRQEKEEKDKNYHFSERAYGSFQRAFELPAKRRSQQDRGRFLKRRADDYPAEDGSGSAAGQEDRGQIIIVGKRESGAARPNQARSTVSILRTGRCRSDLRRVPAMHSGWRRLSSLRAAWSGRPGISSLTLSKANSSNRGQHCRRWSPQPPR
jgi:HSP20 family protein